MSWLRSKTLVLFSLIILSISVVAEPEKTPFWKRVARFFGVAANPGKQKGPGDEVKSGDIWIANIADVEEITRLQITSQGGFRSPIFLHDNQTILAIKDEKVVEVSAIPNAPVKELFTSLGLLKLVGLNPDQADEVLALSDLDRDNCPVIGILTLSDQKVTAVPYETEEDKQLVTHLQSWKRQYANGDIVEVRIGQETLAGRKVDSTNVWLKRGDHWINVSRCDPGINCSHPSISPGRQLLTFVKAK